MDAASPLSLRTRIGLDLQGALSRLAALPLSRPAEAERQLATLFDELIANPPAPRTLFQILENSGEALYFVREMAAQKFQQSAPHLKTAEEELFESGVLMWRKVATAYGSCSELREAARAGGGLDPRVAEYEATLLHRCLHYTGMLILDHYRAKREIPADTWRRFHAFYRRAEELGVAELAVEDLLQEEGGSIDCKSVWIAYLLVEITNPYCLDSRDLGLILRWASREAGQVTVLPVPRGKRLPHFLVVLSRDAPLLPATDELASREDACELDTTTLTAKMALALEMLKKGEAPPWLGIGENGLDAARQLLRKLLVTWSLKAGRRRFRRVAIKDTALVCTGFNAMHYFVRHNNRASMTPSGGDQPVIAYRTEPWEVLDQSPGGFRLATRDAATQPVIGQLIAFLPHDGEQYLLGQINWIKRERGGRLVAGVSVLPGVPEAFSVHIESRIKGQPPIQACAFLLSALPAMGAPDSVVLPAGLYRPEHRLATDHFQCRYIVPEGILQNGPDFDRISFRPA